MTCLLLAQDTQEKIVCVSDLLVIIVQRFLMSRSLDRMCRHAVGFLRLLECLFFVVVVVVVVVVRNPNSAGIMVHGLKTTSIEGYQCPSVRCNFVGRVPIVFSDYRC